MDGARDRCRPARSHSEHPRHRNVTTSLIRLARTDLLLPDRSGRFKMFAATHQHRAGMIDFGAFHATCP